MEIPTQNANSKYSKTKNYTKKIQKLKKKQIYIRRPQIKKFYEMYPSKSGNSYSKYIFELFNNQELNYKRLLRAGRAQTKGSPALCKSLKEGRRVPWSSSHFYFHCVQLFTTLGYLDFSVISLYFSGNLTRRIYIIIFHWVTTFSYVNYFNWKQFYMYP